MARKSANQPPSPRLFEHHERELTRRLRRQRALFIPKYVAAAGSDVNLTGKPQDRAYEIAVRWAELESSGWLADKKETSIDTQFLDQLFGEGLGYASKTTSPEGWQLEHKLAVPGVGTADGAIGEFPDSPPTAVIELKDARTDLDRDRFNGRTAVQQCWDYLAAIPECRWGIVSNFSTIRLYHKSKGSQSYEEFSLQEIRERDRFNEFYAIFERGGLLRSRLRQPPRAEALLARTENRQKEVGDELYESYQRQRTRLIEHLMREHGKPLDAAIAAAQKLLDRVIFIAFCEDRGLMRSNALEDAGKSIPAFSRATNPRWRNFLRLFEAMDKGTADNGEREIPAFNGGLFARDPEVDDLDLEDEPWTIGFSGFGGFDFSEEVNVEVLGHLFERSITELEKLRVGGLFALKASLQNGKETTKQHRRAPRRRAPEEEEPAVSKMPKSAQRKRFGIYYTPPALTGLIVERTVDALVRERFADLAKRHGVDPEARTHQDPGRLRAYWEACLEGLKSITVCDPACGSGAFLIRAYDALDAHYKSVVHGLGGAGYPKDRLKEIEDEIPDLILRHNLFGVDLSREAVEITQLALWIRSARRGKTLADLSANILHGNSLVSDPAVDPAALDWHKAFPAVFAPSPAPGGGGAASLRAAEGAGSPLPA